MKKILSLLFISSIIIGLSACGQSGALYMPKEKQTDSGTKILQKAKSSIKVDDDPTSPSKDNNPTSSQLIDDDNFSYDKNILDSSQAGGTPTL